MRALCLVALLVALALVPAASGRSSGGVPWPITRVTVWNDTAYGQPVRDAIAAWDAVGTRVELVPARSRAGARVVVGYLGAPRFEGQVGEGSFGWAAGRRGRVSIVHGLSRRVATLVAAHELGHVLGLDHAPGCSVMAAEVETGPASGGCGLARCPVLTRCLVAPRDAGALRDLYERRLPELLPAPVSRITASATGPSLVVRWDSPTAGPGGAVLVRIGHTCPSSPYAAPLSSTVLVPLERGARQQVRLPVPGSGTWCAGVWVQETSTYLTSIAATVRLLLR